ncbi:mitochondrial ribosomal death-associated protein 3-domain-containing protein [Mycena galericulata]|nr:mitochondrial ribosomal death-associated protein 3-domain-containing protein [Mycena galericulata]
MRPRLLSPGVVTRFHDTEPTSPLRVYGVPKKMLLEFRILGVPCSVTTSTTLSLVRVLEESVSSPSRLVLNGRAGCGKSFLLLQAAEYAAASSAWLVLYIPRARRLVDASTPYTYSLRTRTYLQPRAARETLRRIGTANAHILRFLNTTAPIQLENGDALPEGTPLLDVVQAGQGEEGEPAAHACLEGIIREMATQTVFPLLIAIDDFQALTGRSMYRDPQGRFIRPHHLGIPRLLLEYASGRKPVARGCVLTALSRTDPEFPVPPQLATALHLPADFDASPASRAVKRVRALRAIRVPDALSVREAAALFEVWLDTGPRVEPESGADELFLGKYAESGGNARAFVWGGLLGTLQTST